MAVEGPSTPALLYYSTWAEGTENLGNPLGLIDHNKVLLPSARVGGRLAPEQSGSQSPPQSQPPTPLTHSVEETGERLRGGE